MEQLPSQFTQWQRGPYLQDWRPTRQRGYLNRPRLSLSLKQNRLKRVLVASPVCYIFCPLIANRGYNFLTEEAFHLWEVWTLPTMRNLSNGFSAISLFNSLHFLPTVHCLGQLRNESPSFASYLSFLLNRIHRHLKNNLSSCCHKISRIRRWKKCWLRTTFLEHKVLTYIYWGPNVSILHLHTSKASKDDMLEDAPTKILLRELHRGNNFQLTI